MCSRRAHPPPARPKNSGVLPELLPELLPLLILIVKVLRGLQEKARKETSGLTSTLLQQPALPYSFALCLFIYGWALRCEEVTPRLSSDCWKELTGTTGKFSGKRMFHAEEIAVKARRF